ncbi:hypothetical protein ASE04_22510 [Rhizobium sp. Root708]|uniref:hypothetical protein n=1 Tax=Rhizobium sp. Root708 TaxID=1736592 RepID=UPI0006FDFAFC|nr:hypothetical protein [Rhizobium sp. Root708]KRB61146.1 hypothetical protein ASE04_22510 [Rhizobium sp. Root708]
MISFTNTHLSEEDGLLSLSLRLLSDRSGSSYTLRCELRRDVPTYAVSTNFDQRLQSLRRSIDNSVAGN